MTPQQQKAKELVEKFSTKEDALKACDEILNYIDRINNFHSVGLDNKHWQSVKQEITNLT